MLKNFGMLIASAAFMTAGALPAYADTIICSDLSSCSYNLDDFIGTGNPPPGPYGTITLVQNGSNVDVSVILASGNVFAVTGSGQNFLWDFENDPSLSVVLTGSSAGEFKYITNYSKPTVGAWDYGFECTVCGNGTSPPNVSTLTFEIQNSTLSQFIQNAKGYDFASDLGINCTSGQGQCYTGPVLGDSTSPVPEPTTLSIFGLGLLGLGSIRRNRKQATA